VALACRGGPSGWQSGGSAGGRGLLRGGPSGRGRGLDGRSFGRLPGLERLARWVLAASDMLWTRGPRLGASPLRAALGLGRGGSASRAACTRRGQAWQRPEGHDTGVQVYNSLTGRKDPLIVARADAVSWCVGSGSVRGPWRAGSEPQPGSWCAGLVPGSQVPSYLRSALGSGVRSAEVVA
jgi:hypothetical protein